jgi:hypothetical protein
MKRWQGSCMGALLVLLIGGGSLIFLVPFGGAMIAGMPPVFDKLLLKSFVLKLLITPIMIMAAHRSTRPTPVAGQVTLLS